MQRERERERKKREGERETERERERFPRKSSKPAKCRLAHPLAGGREAGGKQPEPEGERQSWP